MATHNDTGKEGEHQAALFLEEKGYTILEKNWFFQKAEIDIIAQIEDTLAVIEVKTRSSLDFGLPQDFVNSKKIQNLIKAIDGYVVLNDLDVNVRFDIMAIHKIGSKFEIEHIEDAFHFF